MYFPRPFIFHLPFWILSIFLGYVVLSLIQWMELNGFYLFWASSLSSQQCLPLFCGINMCCMKYTFPKVILSVICGYLILSVPVRIIIPELQSVCCFKQTHLICCSPVVIFSSAYLEIFALHWVAIWILPHYFGSCILQANSIFLFFVYFPAYMSLLQEFLVTPLFILDTEKSYVAGGTQNFDFVLAGEPLL